MSERSDNFVRSIERGLATIASFSSGRQRQRLSDVAQATGLTRATARRVLLTLESLGYVKQENRYFRLTPKVLNLGYSFLSSLDVVEIAEAPMGRLVTEVGESSLMGVLDGDEVVCVARVPTRRILTISLQVGSRMPAYPTSMGRVLLSGRTDAEIEAYLDRVDLQQMTPHSITSKEQLLARILQVRSDGYAVVDQELGEGVRSAAAPVRNARREIVAAVNVSCHAGLVNLERLRQEVLPRLIATTEEISASMAGLRG